MNTILENNFKKLLETLKDCLQPKDKNPENRPDCSQLLDRINQLTVDKTVLMEDKNGLESFESVLAEQELSFLKMFFNYKLNQKPLS